MRHTRILRRATRAAAALSLAPIALLAFLAPVAAAPQARPAASSSAINIPFEKYTLPNGLTVILAPDHTIPQAAVDVWYHVGSKNEQTGRTGFAHMFEHVMFTGSGHVPYGLHDRLTEGVGGNNNGSTSNDRTNYYENVPSNYVESALWMEADRMGFLLDKLDNDKFVAQRDIVQNERRQGIDNQPYGRAFEIITAAMLPDTHVYSWPVVGYMADLQKATVDDVKQFFRLYYAPNNATIAIVGDFDPVQVKRWITKYFADLPKGAPITRPTVAPVTLTAERRLDVAAPATAGGEKRLVLAAPATAGAGQRLVFEDRVQVARMDIAWPAPGEDSDDTHALNFVAQILSGPRTARITKTLVFDEQSAASVSAFNFANEKFGQFFVRLTPRPGHSLTELEARADSIIEKLKRDGPTAEELARAKAGLEFGFISQLQSNLGKAEMLISGQVFHGDAGHYKAQYAKLKAVTAADVRRVANKYLGPGRVVLSIVPQGKVAEAAKADQSVKVTVSPDGGHYIIGTR
ncbi:MAG TPA: pitrilysin family protein [Gemmatimonadaceae bacterium]|nr:pitrilysin family protein [Gemmatimonadaceae bacterium]